MEDKYEKKSTDLKSLEKEKNCLFDKLMKLSEESSN